MKQERFEELVRRIYIDRNSKGIKTDFGRAWIIGGSSRYPNAVTICSKACSMSGVSFQEVSVPSSIQSIVFSQIRPTAVSVNVSTEDDSFLNTEELFSNLKSVDSILFGNGVLKTEKNIQFLESLLENYTGILLLDAGGIDLFAEVIKKKEGPFKPRILLTPHLGEASRLLSLEKHSRDPKDYLSAATIFAKRYRVNLLLKSTTSIFVSQEGECEESCSLLTPSLGKAGSGDGLAGYLLGIAAQRGKDTPLSDIVCFADLMIHKAAFLSERKITPGLADILTAIDSIPEIVLEISKTN